MAGLSLSFKSNYSVLRKKISKNDLLISLVVAIALILVGVSLGWYNNKVVPISPATSAHYISEPSNPLTFMSNWDGPDYLAIASKGYQNISQTNFFPLYPMLVRAVHYAIPSLLDSALLISWVCLAGAIFFYIKIIRHLFTGKDNLSTIQGLLLFILFPTAVFLLATYTESLFMLFALSAIYCALKKRWLAAAILTMACTATHITGVFVLLLVAMILIEEKIHWGRVVSGLVIGSLGLGSYMIYLKIKFNSALAFVTSQEANHGWLGQTYGNIVKTAGVFNIIFVVLLICSAIYWWKRRKSFAVYSFLFLCIPLIGHQYGGFNRYVLAAFPMQFMLFEVFRNKKVGYGVLMVCTSIAWTYFLLQYAGGYVGG